MAGTRLVPRAALSLATLALVSALISTPVSLTAANRYDPALRFRVLNTPHFSIYFHQREEALAQRLALIAERVHGELRARLQAAPRARTHVVLVDQNDRANGWATPLPYNTIEIGATWPSGRELVGNVDDWLTLVFTHEYTHIVHLDQARGWASAFQKVFGRAPLFFPNLYLPAWQVEGLATHEESALTGRGRVRAGDFAAIVDVAARQGRAEPIDRANGGLIDWPSGVTPYAYGAYFYRYLADRFGEEKVAALSHDTSGRFYFTGARAFRKVFGRGLSDLWRDFERARAEPPSPPSFPDDVRRLTRHGFSVSAPRFIRMEDEAGLRVAYSLADPHDFPAVLSIAPDGSRPARLATRFGGDAVGQSRGVVYFDQLEIRQNVATRSDLYAFDIRSLRHTRLTRDARLVDPDVSPDGRLLAAVRLGASERALVVFDLKGGEGTRPALAPSPRLLLGDPGTQYASPRFSPDGRSLVAERRVLLGPSDIVRIDLETRATRVLAGSARGRLVTPTWSPDGGTVVFASDWQGGAFDLYAVDAAEAGGGLAGGSVFRLTRLPGGATWPDISPDGRTLVFVGYTHEGYDLFTMPYDRSLWQVAFALRASAPKASPQPHVPGSVPGPQSQVPSPVPSPQSPFDSLRSLRAGQPKVPSPYSPVRTLLPTWWLPNAEAETNELRLGAYTSGMDVLGRHAYSLSALWRIVRRESGGRHVSARPDWSLSYAYDRWRPTFFAAASDETTLLNVVRPGSPQPARLELREQQAEAGVVLPVIHARRSLALRASLALDRQTLTGDAVGHDRHAARLAWVFDNTKFYGYSISPEQGVRTAVTGEHVRTAFGADGNADAVTAEARAYARLGGRHRILALRAGLGLASGDEGVRRLFYLGGPRAGGLVDFGSDALGLLRGFETKVFAGTRIAALNAEYRLPIARIERGVRTWPFFVETIHASAFLDAGTAWTNGFSWGEMKTGAGAEIGLALVLGYSFPLTASFGVAWPHDPAHRVSGAQVYARLGRAF